MVLNGKAELNSLTAFGATIIRKERAELCVIVAMLTASTVISCRLYYCMVDGWQSNTQLRWQVFSLSLALLLLSVTACLYLCRRHRPTLYLYHSREFIINFEVRTVIDDKVAFGGGLGVMRAEQVEFHLFSILRKLFDVKGLFDIERLVYKRSLDSVNSQAHLTSGKEPPSYNAVTPNLLSSSETDTLLPPPPYNAVFSV